MGDRSITRRGFLAGIAAGAALPLWPRPADGQTGPAPPRQVRITPTGGPWGKSLLSSADFTYAGSFQMPPFVDQKDATWGTGLTHRYVGDELRLFMTTLQQTVFEVRRPELRTSLPYEMAPVVRHWGDVSGTKRFTEAGGTNSGGIYGLYWDSVDERLYWSYGWGYNAVSGDDPSVGFSTLNETSGTATPVGAWRFTGRGCKATLGGVVAVPKWFSDAYCPKQRLAAGFGGIGSVVTVGPVHMGPALCAFTPPDPAVNADRSSLNFTNLVGYPYNGTPYTEPDRCHRDTNYRNEFDGWNPRNGIGYWSWTDFLYQSATWIDLPAKHGVLFLPTLGVGRGWYQEGGGWSEGAAHWFYVYDPQALASVTTGAKKQWEVQPARTWQVKYPGVPDPQPAWRDQPAWVVTGVTFDSVTSHLYVAVRFSAPTGGNPTSSHAVHVYLVG